MLRKCEGFVKVYWWFDELFSSRDGISVDDNFVGITVKKNAKRRVYLGLVYAEKTC